MRISDWSSDVCSSDLAVIARRRNVVASESNQRLHPPNLREQGFCQPFRHYRQKGAFITENRRIRVDCGGDLFAALRQRPSIARKRVESGKKVNGSVDHGGGRNFQKKKDICK